jgi:toxin ParE1/3/4
MNRILVISTFAEADMAEATNWYNQIRPGLGNDLILCFEQALDRILQYPEAFPLVLHDARRILIRRYPYGVFFRVSQLRIEVEAVFALRADPANLAKRLGTPPSEH